MSGGDDAVQAAEGFCAGAALVEDRLWEGVVEMLGEGGGSR
ncbi:hypothetical protein [uncultured Shimia sp.]|nr:hypothetical protein [uncultured Shimia sp.]